MSGKNAMIGDYLGTIEEFLPGRGTYAQDGKIYAACMGEIVLDSAKHLAEVKGKSLPKLREGQVVFGEVSSIKKSQVIVIVSRILGIDTPIDERSFIYVSNISDKFVDKPEDMFAVGDIVKAEVFKIKDDLIDLSTKGDLGVVKAFCRKCRRPLVKSDKREGKMECLNCGHLELRKTAKDYGNVCEI
ncbi:MAG TPA: hypothetical protein ENN13_02170 [Candidatus Altiarchaeales archaeon]|nr:hypothetical protein [Candidatus Altiarchaeales archaeon]